MGTIKMILGIGKTEELTQEFSTSLEQYSSSESRSNRGTTLKFGFTLVEMLIVLAIMAMLMGISIPFTSGFGKGLKIKTTTRAIIGMMRVARSNAQALRKNYSVVFDVKKDQFWVEDDAGQVYEKKYPLPSSIKFGVKGDEKLDPVTFENDRVMFNPSGLVDGSGGSVTIIDKQGSSRTISVTGAIEKVTAD